MKTLMGACAVTGIAATTFYLQSNDMPQIADAILIAYVGTVSFASAGMTAKRTYKWTALGVGVFLAAIAIGIEGVTNAAYHAGWIDVAAVHEIGPWSFGGTIIGPWLIETMTVIELLTALVRALLLVGYTYLLLGLIQNRVTVDSVERPEVDSETANWHAGSTG